MKRIALIHTVRSVLESFEPLLRGTLSEQPLVHNLLDDFLATDPAALGYFSEDNRERLRNDLRNAELTGADLIVVTCSTLTPAVEILRRDMRVPVIAIDDALCRAAAASGPRIAIMATARTTLEPTRGKILFEARAAGREVEIRALLAEDALAALKAGNSELHDQLLERTAAGVSGADVVVLAQASMARAEERIAAACGLPVLSSPALCAAEVKRILEG